MKWGTLTSSSDMRRISECASIFHPHSPRMTFLNANVVTTTPQVYEIILCLDDDLRHFRRIEQCTVIHASQIHWNRESHMWQRELV